MNFRTAVLRCFMMYAVFSGRASRSEFWWFFLFCIILGIMGSVVDSSLGLDKVLGGNGMFQTLIQLATFLPSIAVGSRRLHDVGKSGWWQLLWIVIFIGWIPLIIWLATSGPGRKHCVWCGESSYLELIEGNRGELIWKYRNVDGSRDKRSINNFQVANYFSSYKCNAPNNETEADSKCDAETNFMHEFDKNPGINVKVVRGNLSKEGNGLRTSENFRYKDLSSLYDNKVENRKNSEESEE